MQNHKYLYITFGLFLFILSFVKFLNQEYPPKINLIREIYYYLNGFDRTKFDNEGWFGAIGFTYNISKLSNDYFYYLEYIQFNNNKTMLRFRVSLNKQTEEKSYGETKQNSKKGLLINPREDPFQNPVIEKNSQLYPLLRKIISPIDNISKNIDLFFPEINRGGGDIGIWANYGNQGSNPLFILSSPTYDLKYGSPIWFITSVIGLIILLIGLFEDSDEEINKKIGTSVRNLDKLKKDVLESIEGRDSYSSLSVKDKYRYNSAISFLDNSQNTILTYYRNQISYPNKFFPNLFSVLMIFGILFFLIYLIYTAIGINFPELISIVNHFSLTVGDSSGKSISERVINLETSSKSLRIILLLMFIFGIIAILINYFSGLFYAKYIVQRESKKQLALLHNRISLSSNRVSKKVENQINELQNVLGLVESKFSMTTTNIQILAQDYLRNFNREINKNIKGMRKSLRSTEKQIKKQLISEIKG